MGLGWGRVDVAAGDQFSGTPRLELLLQPLGDSYAEVGSFDFDFTSSEIPARAQGQDLVLTVAAEGDAAFSVTTTAGLEPGKGWSPVESTEEVDADSNTQIVVPLDSQESLGLIGQHLLVMGDVTVYDETAKTITVTATLRIDDGPVLDKFETSAHTTAWYKAQGVHTPSPGDETDSQATLSQNIVADGGAQGNGQVATVIEAGSLSANDSRKKPSVVAYQAPVNTTLDCDSVEVEVGSRTLARTNDDFTSLCYDRRLLIDFSADPFTAADAPIKPVITVRSDITASGMLLGLGRAVVLDADTGYTMVEATPPQPTPAPTRTEPTTVATDPAPTPAEPVAPEATSSSGASKLPWLIAGGLVLAGATIVVALIKRRAPSGATAPLDLEVAVRRGASLHDETWFADMTADAANLFRDQLGTIVRPDESVVVAISAPVDDGSAQPGLLVVTDEERFVVCWATGFAGRQKHHESYPLGSVPCTLTRTTVAGIPGEAWVLQLGSRRVVMPSKQLGEDLRGTFAGGPIPG